VSFTHTAARLCPHTEGCSPGGGSGWASPTPVALKGTETETTDPQAPWAEKQLGSRARTCHCNGRGDLNNLCHKYCSQISACNKTSMCRLKCSHCGVSLIFKIEIFPSSVNAGHSASRPIPPQELAFSDISLCVFRLRVAVHGHPSFSRPREEPAGGRPSVGMGTEGKQKVSLRIR